MARVAVIEDNPDNRLLTRAILGAMHELVEFETGVGVEDTFAEAPPDLVLLDISLPGLDGTEVLAKLREAGFVDLPIIALTAHAMPGDRERLLALGFDDYISKPILDFDGMITCVDEHLARRVSPDRP